MKKGLDHCSHGKPTAQHGRLSPSRPSLFAVAPDETTFVPSALVGSSCLLFTVERCCEGKNMGKNKEIGIGQF